MHVDIRSKVNAVTLKGLPDSCLPFSGLHAYRIAYLHMVGFSLVCSRCHGQVGDRSCQAEEANRPEWYWLVLPRNESPGLFAVLGRGEQSVVLLCMVCVYAAKCVCQVEQKAGAETRLDMLKWITGFQTMQLSAAVNEVCFLRVGQDRP